ncbi:MAG TPA: CPBP family intramembrane metalloprotease [Xanthomonadaceae bacterium]|nr:CPBP family intramembrane metalloprotease [Xanthomonadaceae bacterium]
MTAPQPPSSTLPAAAAAAIPDTAAVPRAPRPLLGFFIDLLIGVGVLLLVSTGAMLVWGMARGVALAMQARRAGSELSADQVAALMGQPGALAQMVVALVSTGSAALLLYFWRRRAGAEERRRSHAAALRPSTWGRVLLVACAVFAFSSAVSFLAEQAGIKPVPSNLALMEEAVSRWPWFLIAFAVVIAPAYEELLFRRVLFGRLLAAGRPWLGMALSSLAFALLHEVPGISGNGPLAILQLWLVYAAMGAAFAWLYWRTGTLWAAVAAHALNNAIALAALYFFGIP